MKSFSIEKEKINNNFTINISFIREKMVNFSIPPKNIERQNTFNTIQQNIANSHKIIRNK